MDWCFTKTYLHVSQFYIKPAAPGYTMPSILLDHNGINRGTYGRIIAGGLIHRPPPQTHGRASVKGRRSMALYQRRP